MQKMRDKWRFATESEPYEDELYRGDDVEPDEEADGEDEGVDNEAVLALGIKVTDATRAALVAVRDRDPDRVRLLKVAERLSNRLRKLNETMEAADG
jgi:hypothetical protein